MNIPYLQEAWLISAIIILILWEAVWKLIVMWKVSRNNHLVWFICIALINTICSYIMHNTGLQLQLSIKPHTLSRDCIV
ncbi:MAG: DUF5652 family protein [Dysgonamonadaceae bacterium]|jgi:Co/Zn/Cd efflux system component|nr:DUF5652 family protein [Dysgonamonadaceae bacterium]MDD4605592.1 DUF5652 family protein [Dysgonamonadaceae bacterium]